MNTDAPPSAYTLRWIHQLYRRARENVLRGKRYSMCRRPIDAVLDLCSVMG